MRISGYFCARPKAPSGGNQTIKAITQIFITVTALLIFSPYISVAQPFSVGERLVFELSWYGINGGISVMEVQKETNNGRTVYKITSTTKSNKFISVFFPVNDVVETYVDMKSIYPYRFRSRQREGSYTSDKEIIFDRDNNVATSINHKGGGERHISIITPGAQDPLSVAYFFRTVPVAIGKSVYMDVFDGKKNWTLVIKILKREKVWTPAGTFNTIKTKALVKFEGLFVNKGDVYVWFTDDDARIPVMMESKIKIGHITAMLIEKRN